MSSTDCQPKQSNSEGVPSPGDPDRKRVLNVLAQRRYRQRRRERIAALEAQARASAASNPNPEQTTFPTPIVSPNISETIRTNVDGGVQIDSNFQHDSIIELSDAGMASSSSADFNPDFGQSFDMPGFTDLDLNFPSSSPSASHSNALLNPGTALQHPSTTSPIQFPLGSDINMTIPSFSTLRSCLTIASLLSVQHTLFDLNYSHTLSLPPSSTLPPNLHPTDAQILIPHHPLLDILPWPSVRTKLIYMLASGASQFSTGSLAIMQLVNDWDDLSEGCRVSGTNELIEENWEVGEAMLRNWWWAFDGEIVERTNRLRAARGVGRLRISGVGV